MYSLTHEALFVNMISEMLQYAGFQESVNQRLRDMHAETGLTEHQGCCVDDLYDQYGNQQVMDD